MRRGVHRPRLAVNLITRPGKLLSKSGATDKFCQYAKFTLGICICPHSVRCFKESGPMPDTPINRGAMNPSCFSDSAPYFAEGHSFHRLKEIYGLCGGGQQNEISSSVKYLGIFLSIGESGKRHRYQGHLTTSTIFMRLRQRNQQELQ